MTREEAQEALNNALQVQSAAKVRLQNAVAAVQAEKANVLAADGMVLIARADLARLGGPVSTGNGKGSNQSDVCAAVAALLKGAPAPLTNDEVFAGLQAAGVEMGGSKPRENLNAYIARWSKVPASGIVSAGRGKWTSPDKAAAPEVPAFLQPAEGGPAETPAPEVPAFLQPEAPAPEQVPVDGNSEEVTVGELMTLPLLPEGFPGRAALIEAGIDSKEQLAGKTHDQLRRIKGVGAETARNILAALEA